MPQPSPSINDLARPRGRVPVRLLLALLVTAALVYAAFRAPWAEVGPVLAAANPWWALAALAAYVSIYPMRLVQWQLIAGAPSPVPWRRMFEIVALSTVASNALSSLAGVAASATLLVTRGRMSVAQAASFMTLDQLLAAITKALVIVWAALLFPLPEPLATAAAGFAGLVVLFLIGVLAISYWPGLVRPLAEARRPWLARAGLWLQHYTGGLHSMRSPWRAAAILVLALLKRGADVAAAYAIQAACGLEASLTTAVLVVAALGVATAVPTVPGSIGVYTATVFVVYQFLGMPAASGIAAGILQHATELLPALVLGYGALLLVRRGPAPPAA
jgi:uncharacterized membrane protein YbhN (UPF0104 family)